MQLTDLRKKSLVASLSLMLLALCFTDLRGQDNSYLQNHFSEGWLPRVYLNPERTLPGALATESPDAIVSVDAKDTISMVLPTQFGVNTPFRNKEGMLTDGIRFPVYERTKLGAYRFPAGSGSNTYFYDGNIPGQFLIDVNAIDGTKDGNLKPEHFAKFVDSLGTNGTIVVNYFYARYGIAGSGTREERVLQAAQYAAGFVHKMNVELKAGIKYWEVGNECYGKWEVGWDVNGSIVTGKEYGEDFRVFAEEMKKVDSTIKVGAVLYSQETDWNPQVIPEVENHADFFVIHNYFTAEKDATPENILGSVGQIKEIISMLTETMKTVSSKTLDDIPATLTEFNCRGPYTTNMLDALFVSQILGELIENNYGLSTMWVSEWKWDSDQEPKSFLAVSDPAQNDYTPRPVYMPFYYYGKCFGDHMLACNVSGNGVYAYASRFSGGEIGLALINTNGSSQNVKLDIQNPEKLTISEVEWYEVYANSIEPGDKKFYINGFTGTTPGGGPEEYYRAPPYHSVVEDSCILDLPAYSINFAVLKVKDYTGTQLTKELSRTTVSPNPASHTLQINSGKDIVSYGIYSESGILVKKGVNSGSQIEISDLKSGYFILKIMSTEQIETIGFFKL